nr:hypothetical protein [uncultured Rhodopila sp.]
MTLADRLIDLNRWYEGLPDGRRVFVYPAVLVAAGFVNTRLTGAPIGWVSVSALLALIAARKSYVSGWLTPGVTAGAPVAETRHRAVAEAVAPAAIARPAPVQPAPVMVPKAETVVPVATEPKAAAPAVPVYAPVVAPVAVQEPVKPATRVEAATAVPPSPPAVEDNHAKNGKRANGRKNDGKSGKRKPGDKHAH